MVTRLEFDLTTDRGIPEIYTRGVHQQLTDIAGARWDADYGVYRIPWYWPVCFDVQRDILQIIPNAKFTNRAACAFRDQKAWRESYKKRYLPYQPDYHFNPFQHQKDATSFMCNMWRCGLDYEAGIGKTKSAVDAIMVKKQQNPQHKFLYVTDVPTVIGTLREFELHSKGQLKVALFWGERKKRYKSDLKNCDVVLTTYHTLFHDQELMAKIAPMFHGVFADECHRVRNWTAQITKAFHEVTEPIAWRCLLTGTPGYNPEHWFSYLTWLSPGLVPERTFSKYKDTFIRKCPRTRHRVLGYKNMDVLHQRINSIFLRRKVKDCIDLPERTIITIPLDLSPTLQKAYNEIIEDASVTVNGKTIKLNSPAIIDQLTPAMQVTRGYFNESQRDPEICDGCPLLHTCISNNVQPYTTACEVVKKSPPPITHKLAPSPILTHCLERVCQILDADPTNKILIWFRSNVTLQIFAEMFIRERDKTYSDPEHRNSVMDLKQLPKQGKEHIVMVGGCNYGKVVKEFNENPEVRVLFGQVAAGIGVTMTTANYTIYPEVILNSDHRAQSAARNYRPGQDRPVFIIQYEAVGTLDSYASTAHQQKVSLEEALGDPDFCNKCTDNGKCLLNMCNNPKEPLKCRRKTVVDRARIQLGKTRVVEGYGLDEKNALELLDVNVDKTNMSEEEFVDSLIAELMDY